MDNPNIQKWIYGVRKLMNENGINDSDVTDEQCLDILKGLFIPALPDETRQIFEKLEGSIFAMLYFKSMLSLVKPEGGMFEGIDIQLLRIKLNKN